MTYICASFVFVSKQFVGMGAVPMAYIWGGLVTLALTGGMVYMMVRNNKSAQLNK